LSEAASTFQEEIAMAEQIPVYVVSGDPNVCHSVESISIESLYQVKCYRSTEDFSADTEFDSIGCVVVDAERPERSGLNVLSQLQQAESPLAVVGLTRVANVPLVVALMEAGAVTVLELSRLRAALISAIARAADVSRQRLLQMQKRRSLCQRLQSLSEEEQTVMVRLLHGEPNKAIASTLNLSMRTVDRRRQSILAKMRFGSVPELAICLGTAGCVTERS
jgi:FixJ family two-component response regulator